MLFICLQILFTYSQIYKSKISYSKNPPIGIKQISIKSNILFYTKITNYHTQKQKNEGPSNLPTTTQQEFQKV